MSAAPLATGALALAAALLAGSSFGSASSDPSSAPVVTSRGDYRLLVYPPREETGRPPVLLISGEGGWRRFDQTLGRFFADAGHWVGGMDSLKYFWHPQDDPRALAGDVEAYVAALLKASGRPQGSPVILAGFSFGADLAPRIAGAWTGRSPIAGLVMLGPDEVGSLQFRVLEIFGFDEKDHVFSVAEALATVKAVPILFLHGDEDAHSDAVALFRRAPDPKKLIHVSGSDHHFAGHEDDLRARLTEGLAWLLQVPRKNSPGR
ncbi:MAG TPA: AcvB/VirJ family lysyl-phosphatidylglycerol hydrolase [Candidatus Polarisedimenticolia bacterium]|jgi:type IV secretory pathway VirJ component|nr:AcvB/VirJ family lysyl-phosphatidylglycerol hydrolase [Candidatus Polarisedimenticolia bacterium]